MVNPMEKMAEADTNKICQERKRKGKTSTENKQKFARRKARAPSSCPINTPNKKITPKAVVEITIITGAN